MRLLRKLFYISSKGITDYQIITLISIISLDASAYPESEIDDPLRSTQKTENFL